MKLDWNEPESKPTHKPDSIRKLKQASNPSFLLYAYVFLKPPLYHPSCTFPPRVPPFLLSALSDHFLPKKESSIAAITFPLLCPKKKRFFSVCILRRLDGGSIDAYCDREQRQVQAQEVPPGVQEELPCRQNR